jgi:hypothetical protein
LISLGRMLDLILLIYLGDPLRLDAREVSHGRKRHMPDL